MREHKPNILIITLFSFVFLSCGGNAEDLSVGDVAPDFTLEDSESNSYTLSEYYSISPVVIYFYPKASTPGCTKQACSIRDEYTKFKENGIKIFGISVDSKNDIREFVDEFGLNFPLLSDEDKIVANKFGVVNTVGVASRITFIVNKEGKLNHIIRDVNVESHADTVFKLAYNLI